MRIIPLNDYHYVKLKSEITMKKISFVTSVLFLAISLMVASCNSTTIDTKPMAGTLDSPLQSDSIPANVQKAMDNALKLHYHEVMSDTAANIAVFSIDEIDQTPSEGFGFVVTKGTVSTNFLNIINTRQPQAKYNAKTGDLWLTSCAMSGTGVNVEKLYQIRFQEDGKAYIKTELNPYTVQQELLKRIGYTVDGENVTIYDGDKVLKTITNTITDMGGFDEESPMWIGEQLYYDLSGDEPKLVFVPGVKFTTGLALLYDDMPDFSASISIDENGNLTIHEISVIKE
jgi:hypothetical protein